MILILPDMLRSEFLYSRLLLVYCGEESAGYVVKTEKTGGGRRKTGGFSVKTGRKPGKPRVFKACLLDVSLPYPLRLEVSERRERGLGWLKVVLM